VGTARRSRPIGLLCYFLAAIAAHVRAHDTANAATPLALTLIASVTLALRLATL